MTARRLAALVLAAAAAGACGDDAPARPRRWHVAGEQLRDPDGRAVVLRGVNLAGAHKSPPYFDFHQPADYTRVRADWGMSSARFLITWAAVEPARGEYDDAYLDEVALRMEWAAAAGLVVVIDMHQDLYGEGFYGDGAPRWSCDEAHYAAYVPVEPWFANYANEHVVACYDGFWRSDDLQAHFTEAWRRVAARLRDSPAVIGFDVMNEPHWGSAPVASFEEDYLAPFYDRVVAAVRGEAPDWVAFLEPAASRNLGFPTRLPPFPYPDVVYAPHSYDPMAEGGAGFDAARREALVSTFPLLRDEARTLGAALWIGEYGGMAATPGIVEYMDAEYDAQASVTAGGMYWEYGRNDGYGIVDPTGAEKPELVDTLVRPYPERVAGEPLPWEWDESTSTFTFRYRPDATVTAPTIVVVPARRYPGGWTHECGGCTAAAAPGGEALVVTAPGTRAEGVATITIRP